MMDLTYGFEVPESKSNIDELAHEANDLASRWKVAHESRRNLERLGEQRGQQANYQRAREAMKTGFFQVCGLATLAYVLVGVWEYALSWPIYDVALPGWGGLVAIGAMAIGLYISACLSEGTSLFRVLPRQHSRAGRFGRQSRDLGHWPLHPLTGVILGLAFIGVILVASLQRVAWQGEISGEGTTFGFDVVLPSLLYGVELILGMFAFYFYFCLLVRRKDRQLTMRLAEAIELELTLASTAVQTYVTYLTRRQQQGRLSGCGPSELVPPNKELRLLLGESHERHLQPQGGRAEPKRIGREEPERGERHAAP